MREQSEVPEVDTPESLAREAKADLDKVNAALRNEDRLMGWFAKESDPT